MAWKYLYFPAVFRRFLLKKSGVSLKAQVSFHCLGCCAVGWGVVNQRDRKGLLFWRVLVLVLQLREELSRNLKALT